MSEKPNDGASTSQRGVKRVELWECCACGHIDTEGHACPKLNGLTSANGLGEFLPLSAVQALAEWCDDKAHMARAERDCHPDQSRIDYCDGEAHAWQATARRLRDLTNPDKEDGPDE